MRVRRSFEYFQPSVEATVYPLRHVSLIPEVARLELFDQDQACISASGLNTLKDLLMNEQLTPATVESLKAVELEGLERVCQQTSPRHSLYDLLLGWPIE